MEFLESDARIALFLGGIGCGKSFCLSVWMAKMTQDYPGSAGAMASRDYGLLTESLDKEFYFVLTELMGLKDGHDFVRIKSPKLLYTFANKSTVLGLSQKNYNSAFRGLNLNWMALDEAGFYAEAGFFTALGRVRLPPEKIRAASSPQGFNHLFDYFVKNAPKDSAMIKATSYDNDLLSEGYIESLRAAYTPALFQQEVMSEFISFANQQAYSYFDKEAHVSKVGKEKNHSIFVGVDFGVSPGVAVFCQHIDGIFRVFDEWWLDDNSNTFKMAAAIKARYGTNGVMIIPDSTGKARQTTGYSDIRILRNEGFEVMSTHNPSQIDRVANANRLLMKGRVVIDPKCDKLIRDLELVSWTADDKIDKKSDPRLSHISDAWSYILWKMDPLRATGPRMAIEFS